MMTRILEWSFKNRLTVILFFAIGSGLGLYAVSVTPVDAVPDFLAVFGYTDDAAVFWAAWRTMAAHVDEGHRERARRLVASLKGDA